jgi:hypothetical protein
LGIFGFTNESGESCGLCPQPVCDEGEITSGCSGNCSIMTGNCPTETSTYDFTITTCYSVPCDPA